MNVETGAVKAFDDLTPEQRDSGQWVPVSDQVARMVKIGDRVEDRRRKRKAAKASRKRNRGR